jgi:hypothetical protein
LPFQPVPNCAEAVTSFSVGGKEMVNVLHFLFAGSYAQGDLDALASAIDAEVTLNYLPVVTAAALYVETRVRGLTVENDLHSVNNDGSAAGGAAGIEAPSNVSFCVTLRSNFTGRSARGRWYAVPPSSSIIGADSTASSAYVVALLAYLDGVKAAAAAIGWQLVIASRHHNGALRPLGVPFVVTSISARNHTLDSQRGRLPKNH